jgi:hypothetical protein
MHRQIEATPSFRKLARVALPRRIARENQSVKMQTVVSQCEHTYGLLPQTVVGT